MTDACPLTHSAPLQGPKAPQEKPVKFESRGEGSLNSWDFTEQVTFAPQHAPRWLQVCLPQVLHLLPRVLLWREPPAHT